MAIPYSRTVIANVPWYSVLIVLGIIAAVFLAEREEKRLKLPPDTAIDLALVVVPCGIVGARLYYVAMSWQTFMADPLSILYVWEGGVAIYGGVIGGALGVMVYAKRKKLPCLRLMDALIPGVLLAQAIGRWGNYFNMEAYGPVILNPLFQFFPAGVLIPSAGGYTWHMATFFYESLWNFGGFCALWALRRRQTKDGNTLLWYMLIYGSGRFIIEQLREDSLYLAGFRVSQWLSLILCCAAALILISRAAGSNRRGALAGGFGALCLIARWFCLTSPWAYGALLALGGGLGLCLWRQARLGVKPLLWLAAAVALDLAGLILTLSPSPLLSFFNRLHTLLCSLTLPMMAGAFILSLLPAQAAKED